MDIGSALDALATIHGTLSITSPIAASIKKVHTYAPNRDSTLPDTPCWMLTWSFRELQEGMSGRRFQVYTVRCQLFIEDADLNRAAAIATAFHVAWIDLMDQHNQLGGTVTKIDRRGGEPTLGLLTWAEKPYVGLDLYLDLHLVDSTTYSA
ncbi:MAG: hypothetical protein AB7R89_25790 [Dehalococcoidia bacterium]